MLGPLRMRECSSRLALRAKGRALPREKRPETGFPVRSSRFRFAFHHENNRKEAGHSAAGRTWSGARSQIMNEKFFSLPEEKQQAILNAGFRVFSQNAYGNSPMREIAEEAGISKSLLFHYFRNKKELYLFLWDSCARTTIEYLTRYGCYGDSDLFTAMERGMRAKMEIIRRYPDMASFTIRAFYEKDEEVSAAVQESYHRYFNLKEDQTRLNMDPGQFVPGLDIGMMYREMYWASEGYLWEMVQRGQGVDMDRMERDFGKLIEFWKSIYLRKE